MTKNAGRGWAGAVMVALSLADGGSMAVAENVTLSNATSTVQQDYPFLYVETTIDGILTGLNGWAVDPYQNQGSNIVAVWEAQEDQGFPDAATVLTFTMTFGYDGAHSLGKFRLSVTTDDRSDFADGLGLGGDVTANWTELTPLTATAENGPAMTINPDNSILVSSQPSQPTVYTITAETKLTGITGFRLEALHDASLPGFEGFGGPGFANGNFVLTEFQVDAVKGAGSSGAVIVIQ